MRNSWTRAWLATFIVLVAGAALARGQHARIASVEDRVLDWLLDGTDTSFWDKATLLGSSWVLWIGAVVMGLAVVGFDRVAAAVFPLTALFAQLVGLATRSMVERPRPEVTTADSFSFPSITVVNAGVFLGLIVLFLWWLRVPRLICQIATEIAIVLLIAVAIARVLGGQHWPSDTVGSAIVITLALISAALVLEARPRSRRREVADEVAPTDALAIG